MNSNVFLNVYIHPSTSDQDPILCVISKYFIKNTEDLIDNI